MLVISVILLFAGSAAANRVYYDMNVNQSTVMMNTTVKLDCKTDCPSKWRLTWKVPEGGKVIGVKDDQGPIKDYKVQNGGLVASSNTDHEKGPEKFRIRFRIDRKAEEVYGGLHKRNLNLRSFKGAKTTGTVHVDNFLSSWAGYGVDTSVDGDNVNFRAEGPLSLRVKFGKGDYRSKYYEFFGGRPENSSMAYETAVGMTGQHLDVKRLPVAIMPDAEFNRSVSKWSSGEYRSGSAQMRQGLGEEFRPILAHETVHALNDRKLNWDQTSSSYFEEGTASYVEFLVRLKLYRQGVIHRPVRELFGDSVRYDPDKTDNYYKKLPPKGSSDVLWGYYQNDYDYMKRWNPFMKQSSARRRFGYAYSELMIRNYVVNGNGSLRKLYKDIEVNGKIKDPEKKWELFSKHMDMTPCKYRTRQRFEKCIDRINNHSYSVYTASPTGNTSDAFSVEKLKIPEKKKEKISQGLKLNLGNGAESTGGFMAELVRTLNSLIDRLLSLVNSLV